MTSKYEQSIIVDIIGAGAMGLMVGSRLKLAGHKVRIWCHNQKQVDYLIQNGLIFSEKVAPQYEKHMKFDDVFSFYDETAYEQCYEPSLYTIIAIKQNGFDKKFINQLDLFIHATGTNAILLIQNGIGHIDLIKTTITDVDVVQAITSEAAIKIGENIAHTGYGITYLSELDDYKKLQIIEESLNNAGIKSLMSKSIDGFMYNKLIVNAVINPLTAIFRVANGQLPEHEARLKLMKLLFEESKYVIEQTKQITLTITFDDILLVCKHTAVNHSSMYVDIQNGRVTEIEAINGAIVKLAHNHRMQAPINETVYLLVLAQHP